MSCEVYGLVVRILTWLLCVHYSFMFELGCFCFGEIMVILLMIFPLLPFHCCRPPAVPPKEPSSVKCQKSCSKGLTKTCLSLYIGYSGISLSLIGLTAYAIVQIPSIRRSLGELI